MLRHLLKILYIPHVHGKEATVIASCTCITVLRDSYYILVAGYTIVKTNDPCLNQ